MTTKQKFKTVYFSDRPGESAKEKSLTMAFGKRYDDLHEAVKGLSSAEIRGLLNVDSYENLVHSAHEEDLPLNTYCLRQISKSIRSVKETSVSYNYIFDPITVTFKGGAKEPFVRWYSYLEGYSPEFVENIIDRYVPNAKRILDPFAGTGTTAFAVSELGKEAYFCEINPVLQFISLTKIQIRMSKSAIRWDLAARLDEIASKLDTLNQHEPDFVLDATYKKVFGDSQFFDQDDYLSVLRLRNWVDEIRLSNPLLSDLFMIAVLSSLVPASKMKRAGDLRYKTDEELIKEDIDLLRLLETNLKNIASDVKGDVNGLKSAPILICESAKSLSSVPDLSLDAVITSPPYVNGTNYFRNTKIELWFMRCLQDSPDLASFRAQAVTAGINDVTMANATKSENRNVRKVISELERNAYDVRIPKMVDSYFSELTSIFNAIKPHLNKKATVAIDIGDSEYGGVHVPVDELLSKCLSDIGFTQTEQITLRERQSRSGSPLKQVLQVFTYENGRKYSIQLFPNWLPSWKNFKDTLPHQREPFSKRNWGHERHSLCSYMGKLKPAISHHLVKTFVPAGGKILDPFVGVGTIPFEAALQGKASFGFDISPAAVVIANAKTQKVSSENCASVIDSLQRFIKSNDITLDEMEETKTFGFNGKIKEYYEDNTLREILLARRYFKENHPETPGESFVLASLLHILHGNRPYALSRRSHPITPYKPQGGYEYRSLIEKLKEKVYRSLSYELPSDFVDGKTYLQDATGWWPREIEQLDAVITSPPFFDSTRFYVANWLRLWFVGWSKDDFITRPQGFVDERQKKDFSVYEPIFRQARERLKSSGVLVLHLGKSEKCDMADVLQKMGKRWFRQADILDESVEHCETHGVTDKGTVTSHQYLVLY